MAMASRTMNVKHLKGTDEAQTMVKPSYTRSSLPVGANCGNIVDKTTMMTGKAMSHIEQQSKREKNIQVIVRVRPLSKREISKGLLQNKEYRLILSKGFLYNNRLLGLNLFTLYLLNYTYFN